MNSMIENKNLLDLYIETKDDKCLYELVDNCQSMIENSIRKTLRKYKIDEERYHEYFSICYIELMEKIRNQNHSYSDEFSFYSSFVKFICNVVVREINIEKEIFEKNIFYSEIKDEKQIIDLDLIERFYETVNEEICDEKKRIELHKIIDNKLTDLQKKVCVMYFGLEGDRRTSIQIAKELGISRGRVSEIIGQSLRNIRNAIYKEKKAKVFEKEKEQVRVLLRK